MAEFEPETLLPPALARDLNCRALESLNAKLHNLDLNALLVYNFDTVPASALQVLAEQFSLIGDGWELAETETAKRALLKFAIELHRYKGTPWSVEQLFLRLGLGNVVIEEGRSGHIRDGTRTRNGFYMRGVRSTHWAEYRIIFNRLLSNKQAELAKSLLKKIAPKRCHLIEMEFKKASLIRNGFATRNGAYTRGLISN